MMDIWLNSMVHCLDGLGGRATHLILNPSTRKVSYVVVAEKKAPHTERLVPINRVTATTPELILLDYTRARLAQLDRFVETAFIRLETPDRYSAGYPLIAPAYEFKPKKTVSFEVEHIPPDELAIRHDARIEAGDGPVGLLDAFQIEPIDGQITHLVLRTGPIWEQRTVTVPVVEIQRFEERTIYLTLSRSELAKVAVQPARTHS
jgi:hypothetical protein